MTLRAALRHTVRGLPVPAQLWLKRVTVGVRGHDWAGAVRDLRAREQAWLDACVGSVAGAPGRKRILVLALQTSPPWSEIECGLAMALRLRGHDVRGVLCDGLLPICEMNLGVEERPSCEVCVGWRSRYPAAFGFSWPHVSAYLSPADRQAAETFVHGLSPTALPTAEFDGVPIGVFARRELQRYRRGMVFDVETDPAFRRWLVTAVMFVRLFEKLMAVESPDLVLASSGRTLQSACAMAVAASRAVRVVTWDTEATRPDGVVFSHGRPAVEIPLDEAWAVAAHTPLTVHQRARLDRFLDHWAASRTTPFPYNLTPVTDRGTIAAQLGLRPGVPLVAAFANSAWDMAVVGRDVGFSSVFDWLMALVAYARARPAIDVVIRAHPAETNVPEALRSRTPVPAVLRARCAPLPDNVKLVAGDDPVSSYVLAEMSDVAMVYSSRFGLELALRGKRPWVAGDVTYRGKGFTRDILSASDMQRLLNEDSFGETLSRSAVDLAARFAYLWFFRYVTPLPLLRPTGGHFHVETLRVLARGGDPALDRICDAVEAGLPFIDLASESV